MPKNVLDAVEAVEVDGVQLEDAEVKLSAVGRNHVDRHRLRKNAGYVGSVNVSV